MTKETDGIILSSHVLLCLQFFFFGTPSEPLYFYFFLVTVGLRHLSITAPCHAQIPKHHDPFGDIDDVPPNVRLFSMRTAVYIFKDHEADLVMWARQEEGQELRKVIKYMSERQEKFLAKNVT